MSFGPSRFDDETWVVPPIEARANARYFLRSRSTIPKSKRGTTEAGVRRAQSIAKGELQPAKEIHGWFARHEGYIAAARKDNKRYEDSKALQSDKAWGGTPMKRAARRALKV